VNQLVLFGDLPIRRLQTFIERRGKTLQIPEGIDTVLCTHGIHRFPGKFIPNLPRYLIREYLAERPSKLICDPFCGSGTTLVEAALEGRTFLGIDVDPLAVLVSEAKVNALFDDELSGIEEHWSEYDFRQTAADLVPDVPNLSHWFSERTIKQLSGIKAHCARLPDRTQRFCLVVFSSILRRVSNADDQTQKTYVSHTLPKTPPLPSELFPVFLRRALKGMRDYVSRLPKAPSGTVTRGDARAVRSLGNVDIVTSPPYIDSVDYVYNQMLEYFWLLPELGLSSMASYRAFRKIPMGFRSESTSKLGFVARLSKKNRAQVHEALTSIKARSPKEAAHVQTFFQDFATHCEAVAAAQTKGGHYICIVGESVVRGVTIPTIDLMEDLFRSVGYKLEDRMTYEIRRHYMKFPRRSNSGKIKHDHILLLEK